MFTPDNKDMLYTHRTFQSTVCVANKFWFCFKQIFALKIISLRVLLLLLLLGLFCRVLYTQKKLTLFFDQKPTNMLVQENAELRVNQIVVSSACILNVN